MIFQFMMGNVTICTEQIITILKFEFQTGISSIMILGNMHIFLSFPMLPKKYHGLPFSKSTQITYSFGFVGHQNPSKAII